MMCKDILQLGTNALTVTSASEINVSLGSDSTILLNCSFEKEIDEFVIRISWSKKNETEDIYRKINSYYPSGAVYLDLDMQTRSSSITFSDSSPSAILNISEVQCKDNGHYKCTVEYVNSNNKRMKTSTETSVYIQGKNVSFYKNIYLNTSS